MTTIDYRERFEVDNAALSALHARAFGTETAIIDWSDRLERYSLTWIGAFDAERLVGFVNVITDGGAHAFVLDTIVEPQRQGAGIGRRLIAEAAAAARRAGCRWMHVDYEDQLRDFYSGCGFRPTAAGLLRL